MAAQETAVKAGADRSTRDLARARLSLRQAHVANAGVRDSRAAEGHRAS